MATGVWIPAPRFHGDKLWENDGLAAVMPPKMERYQASKSEGQVLSISSGRLIGRFKQA